MDQADRIERLRAIVRAAHATCRVDDDADIKIGSEGWVASLGARKSPPKPKASEAVDALAAQCLDKLSRELIEAESRVSALRNAIASIRGLGVVEEPKDAEKP